MLKPAVIYEKLQKLGVSFWCGVPDSLLKPFLSYVTDHTPSESHIITANEGAAVGLAAGFHLATGKLPLVYLQNSGLGNTVNPLLSLADEHVYSIPMLVLIGWRGEPGTKDEPQHMKQGSCTTAMLESMQMPFIVLDTDEATAQSQLADLVKYCISRSCPHAILVRDNTFAGWKLQTKLPAPNLELSREEAVTILANSLDKNDIIVSTTGKLSRELYELRVRNGDSHERDFYTVGSMGHTASIALGIAAGLGETTRNVCCFDGDGSVLMHMGTLSTIGFTAPKRLRHFIFNNGAHESVGGQPTSGFQTDFPTIAKACGYTRARKVSTSAELKEAYKEMMLQDGPTLLEIQVAIRTRDDLGRPKSTPVENKTSFMNNLLGK